MNDSKSHWETVYTNKTPDQVSWTQKTPQTSLDYIQKHAASKSARIIDVGGGDSNLVDHLLDLGYSNITVLDISGKAIERAKLRLGERADQVNWIVSDIVEFEPSSQYDLWHDRATFHFLTAQDHIDKYCQMISGTILGHLVLGTFSTSGPLKCSGLEITQYSKESMLAQFSDHFESIEFKEEVHTTPFDSEQNFLFGVFKKK